MTAALVFATDGSLSTQLAFLTPFAVMLVALVLMTARERRKRRRR